MEIAPLNWSIIKKLARLPIGLGVVLKAQTKPYDGYLASKSWQIKKKAILLMWGYRCALCNSTTQIEIHHRTYKNVGDERWLDLVPLCRVHHEMVESTGGAKLGKVGRFDKGGGNSQLGL